MPTFDKGNKIGLTSQSRILADYLPLAGGTMTGAILFPDGTKTNPAMGFADNTDIGLYRQASSIRVSINDVNTVIFDGNEIKGGAINTFTIITNQLASSTIPIYTIQGDTDSGFGFAGVDQPNAIAGGGEKARFDTTTTARDTAMLLYDVDNATLERVTVGVADSGGGGFKLLRIPN